MEEGGEGEVREERACLMLAPPSMADTVRAVARCDLPCVPSFPPRAPPINPPAVAVRCAITS